MIIKVITDVSKYEEAVESMFNSKFRGFEIPSLIVELRKITAAHSVEMSDVVERKAVRELIEAIYVFRPRRETVAALGQVADLPAWPKTERRKP